MLEIKEILLQCSMCKSRRPFPLTLSQIRQLAQGASLQLLCRFCTSVQSWVPAEPIDLEKLSSPVKPARAKSVLLVDDDDLIRRLLAKVLEAWDVSIDVAVNGREAFARLASKSYDLMICDLQMPEMDGEELFRHVRDNALIPLDRILFLTGDKRPATREFLDRTGCYYLYKPVQFLELSDNIQAILGGGQNR